MNANVALCLLDMLISHCLLAHSPYQHLPADNMLMLCSQLIPLAPSDSERSINTQFSFSTLFIHHADSSFFTVSIHWLI